MSAGLATTRRRLPGLRFEAQSPPPADSLPRMDVAVFVGFAASGPIDQPVVVEDSAQFAAIFGEDAPLAWDAERGAAVRAYLGPAVRDFFRQGGRRCWIIRVARAATYNYFPVPALLERSANGDLFPAFGRARSEGSWSDALRVGTCLQSHPMEVNDVSFENYKFDLSPNSPSDVQPGDLLHFNLRDAGYGLFGVVESVHALEATDRQLLSPPSDGISSRERRRARRRSVRVKCTKPVWYGTHWPGDLPPATRALVFNHKGEGQAIELAEQPSSEGRKIKLNCALAFADAPPPGSVMRVDFGLRQLWLTVSEINSISDAAGSSHAARVQIGGSGFWPLTGRPLLSPETPVEAERLNFDLLVRGSDNKPLRLGDLGFDDTHPRYWGAWPTDQQRYLGMNTLSFVANPNLGADRELFPIAENHSSASQPNTGTSDQKPAREFYLPLAMPFIADSFLGPIKQTQPALERDGLANFDSGLFLDEKMIETNLENLLSQADYFRYQSPTPEALRGIHAALEIEEATIIAVPDAVHRGWTATDHPEMPVETSTLLVHPKWWRYLDCNPSPNPLPLEAEPRWGNFLDCDLRIIAAPNLETEDEAASGTIALVWSTVRDATRYVVEESSRPDWSGATVIYSGPRTRLVIYGRSAGDFYYRVRAETAGGTSEWSIGIAVRTSSTEQWQLKKKDDYKAAALLDVHRALLRLCAARADLFAVLALPEHYREDDAITYAEILRPATAPFFSLPAPAVAALVLPLAPSEERATSYGALYHPWLITRRDDPLDPWQRMPPDGAACGVMAQRAITRGSWSAPANELLRGVVALVPPLAAGRRLDLQDAQVNIIRHEPRGFLTLAADTLSRDIDLRPINVRRLLILLRRLALRLGENYVFEPNDDSFRRLVQRGFEAALDGMFTRGAFAGRTAATSYQVITDDSLNTPTSVDQGRFIVELRVAPSLPLTFITIRMIQTNDRSLVTELR